ncbi:MAG TPA: protein tyrosine phosphatase [Bacteroidetes bacterium]|nr:protein tyrosine phosphatase [Bacteroidota bacterium]
MTEISRRTISKVEPYKIIFVCLGNICRSPTAEGVFQHLIIRAGLGSFFEIDSAGTGAYHVGEPANSISRATAEERGVKLLSRARKFEVMDLEYYDLIVAMDYSNHENIVHLTNNEDLKEKVILMRDFDPDPDDGQVPDPYFGGKDGFDQVYDIIERSCRKLIEELHPLVKK